MTISSAAGQNGASRQGHYSATKGGVIALTKTVALDYAAKGITANTIPPFVIDTPLLRAQQADGKLPPDEYLVKAIPAGRLGVGEDVAAMCSFLCSEAAGYVTGQVIGVNGGAATWIGGSVRPEHPRTVSSRPVGVTKPLSDHPPVAVPSAGFRRPSERWLRPLVRHPGHLVLLGLLALTLAIYLPFAVRAGWYYDDWAVFGSIRAGGTKLQWDGPNMKFPNAPAAESFLKRQYRAPWSL